MRLQDIHRQVGDAMRAAPIDAPDFTSAILSRVESNREFLAPSVRRKLPWARIGVVAGMALIACAGFVTLRLSPAALDLTPQPAPISQVVSTLAESGEAPLSAIRETVSTVASTDPGELFESLAAATALSRVDAPSQSTLGARMSSSLDLSLMSGSGLSGGKIDTVFVGPVLPVDHAIAIDRLASANVRYSVLDESELGRTTARVVPAARVVPTSIIEQSAKGVAPSLIERREDVLPSIK